MLPPEIKTPLPSVPASEKGKRGQTSPKDQLSHDIAAALKGHRVLRYAAQSQGRLVLTREALRMRESCESEAAFPGDVFRTIDCMTKRRSYFVSVHHHAEFKTASYGGLVTCGSVWACPICASKIQQRRREEIQCGIDAMKAAGVDAAMVTFTFPHYAFHTLADLIERQALAFKLLRQDGTYRRLLASIGFRGLIRSLEVVHGANGWHPHTHELWFLPPGQSSMVLQSALAGIWYRACTRAGLVDETQTISFHCFAVNVRSDVDGGDYLAKQDDSRQWGMADEVAKATSKNGRAKGVHPHHFLIRQAEGDSSRYVEYVRGMKGRRQLYWSPGLKAECGVGEVTDEVLADEPETGAALLALLPPLAWKFVVGNDARCELLDAAESGGFDAVCNLLRSLGVPATSMPLLSSEEVDA